MARIAVSMPYYGCPERVERAVKSVLGQTHRELTLFLVGDGEPPPVALADERLRVLTLDENNGPYFCHALVQRLSDGYDYFAAHDADDYSELDRYVRMLRTGGEVMLSNVTRHHVDGRVEVKRALTGPINSKLFHRTSHCGLVKRERLLRAGGYHPDYRVAYDTMLVTLLMMTGGVTWCKEPSYHYHFRPTGLTHSKATAVGSATRGEAWARRATLYHRCYKLWRAGMDGKIREEVVATISDESKARLEAYAKRFG